MGYAVDVETVMAGNRLPVATVDASVRVGKAWTLELS